MGHPFLHPSSKVLLERVTQVFQDGKVHINPNRHLIFVCGGPLDSGKCLRARFLEYARSQLPNYGVLIAEEAFAAFKEIGEPAFTNLANFERFLSQVADCLLIFPESVGSFGETGFFASVKNIRKKTLIVNDIKVYSDSSFLNFGPIHLIDSSSIFRPAIPISRASPNFDVIKKRLEDVFPRRKRSYRLIVGDLDKYDFQRRAFIVAGMAMLLEPCSVESLSYVLRQIFGRFSQKSLRLVLATLHGARVLGFDDAGRIVRGEAAGEGFLQFPGRFLNRMRLDIASLYGKASSDMEGAGVPHAESA